MTMEKVQSHIQAAHDVINGAAGNHTHAASAINTAAITGVTGTNVQAVLAELAGRIAALESAGG